MITQGFVAPGFERVADAFAMNFEDGHELGAAFAAVHDNRTIVNLWGGYRDRNRKDVWDQQTLVQIFSTTKPIGALVVAMMVDRGLLDYDASVAQYWPEFAAHGKDKITVAQALSHQAGLSGFAEEIDPALWLDMPALADALAGLAPLFPPATRSGYHPMTWGYLADALVRRVAHESIADILQREVCEPAGIEFWIGLPESEHHRCAELAKPKDMPQLGEITPLKRAAFLTKWSAPDRGGAQWRMTPTPSANGYGNALSVARLYGAFAHRGDVDGVRLIRPETFDQLAKVRIDNDDLVLPYRCAWSAGVMRNVELIYGPNPNTFGHSGWGGSLGFADPDAGVSGAYVMNRQSNVLQGDPRARRLIDALYACL